MTQHSKDILIKAANASNNPVIRINSTLRPPERQARAMYDNISNGKIIGYRAPGHNVTELCQSLIKAGKPQSEILEAMTQRICELSAEGKRVSLHCVSEEEYAKTNIIDVSTNIPNPRDFIKALVDIDSVCKVIAPYFIASCKSKYVFDEKEPAIHVEINQP